MRNLYLQGGGSAFVFMNENKIYKNLANELTGRDRTRFLVRWRDGFTCQNCGAVRTPFNEDNKRSFDVHHLGGFCGKRSRGYDKVLDMDGLVTLCHKCHMNHPEHSKNLTKE